MAKLKWTVELAVDEKWVEDGFDLTNERAHHMLCEHLQFANGDELKAKILKAPRAGKIAQLQGYKSVKQMKKDRKEW